MSHFITRDPALFSRQPFVLLLPAYIAGIILQKNAPDIPIHWWLLVSYGCCIAAILLYRNAAVNTLLLRWRLITLIGSCMLTGSLFASLQDIRCYRDWYGHYLDGATACIVDITGTAQPKEKTLYLPAAVTDVYRSGKWWHTRGTIKLYVYRKDSMPAYHAGQRFLVAVPPVSIRNSGNPGSFNYADYAARNGLFHQLFTGKDSLYILQDKPVLPGFTERIQQALRESIRLNVTDSTTRSLIEASVLNERATLDESLLQAYMTTGIIHIIAISGMHITLLAGLILFLLRIIPGKRMQGLRYFIAVTAVWIYITLTGFPPSAVRAAVMFSLLAIGILLNRNGNTINTWAATGLLMLCYNPYWLYDIGMQLSFLAVLSILLFYTTIRNWITTGNRILNWLWQAVAVSIAAQVLVFPLVIYYFHQFPLLGLLASVPAAIYSILLLYGSVVMFVLQLCGISCIWLGNILTGLTTSFHKIIVLLADLTPGSMQHLYIGGAEYWLMMAAIISFAIFFYRKKAVYLHTALFILLLVTGSFAWNDYSALHQDRMVIYNTTHASLADRFRGKKVNAVFPDSSAQAGKHSNYILWPARLAFRATEAAVQPETIFCIGKMKILFLNQDVQPATGTSFPVDFLVVSNACRFDPEAWHQVFQPRKIIIDGSLPRWKAIKWKAALAGTGIPVHWVQEDGAWIYPELTGSLQ